MELDFNKAGWFASYLELREEHPFRIEEIQQRCGTLFSDSDHAPAELMIYLLLQGTGMLYGYPVRTPAGVPEEETKHILKHKFQAKFIFLDSLIISVMLYRIIENGDSEKVDFSEVAESWKDREYYRGQLHEAAGYVYEFFCSDAKVKSQQKFESSFAKRVRFPKKFYQSSIAGVNSLLFWDVYLLLEYVKHHGDDVEIGHKFLKTVNRRRSALKEFSLQVLVAAIHADNILEKEELALFSQFLKSPGLSKAQKTKLERLCLKGITAEDLKIPQLELVGRRFLLDLCLLSVYSDRHLDNQEYLFLREMTVKLGLHYTDLEQSETALGAFLVRYSEQIPFLKSGKSAVRLISHALVDNTRKMLGAVKEEGVETKNMAVTFGKVLREKLRLSKRDELPPPEEIREALEQLKDIPKFAPFFGIVFMPLPGVTELYLALAVSVEKMSGDKVKLLPSNFSKLLKTEKGSLE